MNKKTGFKDIKGIEMCEGDIVNIDGVFYKIKYYEQRNRFELNNLKSGVCIPLLDLASRNCYVDNNYKNLSLEEHKRIANELIWLKSRLQNLPELNYSTKAKRRKSAEMKSLAYIDSLKCALDDLICRDFPNDWQSVYYGNLDFRGKK